jgi:hypothetical protein
MANRPLPVAQLQYDSTNEQTTRRTVELNQQDTETRLNAAISKTDKLSSLALRRFQFLLMGAGNV